MNFMVALKIGHLLQGEELVDQDNENYYKSHTFSVLLNSRLLQVYIFLNSSICTNMSAQPQYEYPTLSLSVVVAAVVVVVVIIQSFSALSIKLHERKC